LKTGEPIGFLSGLGSGKDRQAVGEDGARRFAHVPLPTIRPQGVVGSVNRVTTSASSGGMPMAVR
jgi:hypothetical protein